MSDSDWQTVSAPPAKDEWQTVPPPKFDPAKQMQMPHAPIKGAPSVVGGIMDIANRLNQSTLAKTQGRGFFNTLIHGETPQQYQSDTEAETARMMGASPSEFAKMNPVRKAANEFATQMITDPLTYLGGTGILRQIVEEAGLHYIPAAYKATQAAATAKHGTAFGDAMNMLSKSAGWIHDQMTPGGKPVANAIRELARTQGKEGMKQAERMMSAASGSKSVAGIFGAVGKQMIDKALHGVPEVAQSAIFKAIHEGAIDKLPDALRPAADALVRADRSILWIMGTKSVRNWLADKGFSLPSEFAPFDKGPLGLVRKSNVRENHVPMPHELDDEERYAALENLKRKPGARAATDVRNKFFQQRTAEPPPGWETDPAAIRETWEGSFRSAGRQLGGAQLRKNLVKLFATPPAHGEEWLNNLRARMKDGDLATKPLTIEEFKKMVGGKGEDVPPITIERTKPASPVAAATIKREVPPAVRAAFKSKPPTEMTVPQEIAKGFENAQNIWKSSLFYTPTGHQKNIATLLAIAHPQSFPTAMANYMRLGLGFAKPSTRMKVLKDSIEQGAVPFSNIEQSGLTDLMKRFGPLGKAASKWYGGVGKMLWGWDEAVKDALYKSELKHFSGDAGRAAASVKRKMVDYSQSTPFQEAMRTIVPFATWRTALPQAVTTSLLEHPEYALGLNRATGGALAGQPFSIPGMSGQFQSTNPVSEVNELSNPALAHKYLRSALSPPARLGANAVAKMFGLTEVPYSKAMLEQSIPGANPYGDTPAQEALFPSLGIHKYTPPKRKKYRRTRHRKSEQQGSWLGIPLP